MYPADDMIHFGFRLLDIVTSIPWAMSGLSTSHVVHSFAAVRISRVFLLKRCFEL